MLNLPFCPQVCPPQSAFGGLPITLRWRSVLGIAVLGFAGMLSAGVGSAAADHHEVDHSHGDHSHGDHSHVDHSHAAAQTMVLDDVGLILRWPAGWKVRQPAEGPLAAVAELPPRQALALLTRTPIAATDTANQGVEDLLAELPRVFETYEVIAEERRQITADLYADVIEVRGTARDRSLRHTSYLVKGFGERFALTFATEEHTHDAQASLFESIAASLELHGPNPHNAHFLDLIKSDPGDVAALQQALDDGADIDALDGDGFTALATAVLSRNGPLVQWLLARGADPRKPDELATMLPLVATPPIYELLRQALPQEATPRQGQPSGASDIQWVSPEAQLLEGIKNARLADVEQALASGADLQALEPNYQLSALALSRKLIAEFEALGLDPNRFVAIEELLAKAEDQASR